MLEEYRSLFGLASLRFQGDQLCWILPSGATKKGSAPVSSLRSATKWYLDISSKRRGGDPTRSDEKRILSNVAVLEGAPPHRNTGNCSTITKSCSMKPVPSGGDGGLFFTAKCANRATGPSIHTLRRQRGSAMKILVREIPLACAPPMNVCYWPAVQIWYSVECATLPLSDDDRKRARAKFSRYVPEDITTLLSMTQPPNCVVSRSGMCSVMPSTT